MSTLYCSISSCQAANPLESQTCQACQTPLVKRYLWTVGDRVANYGPRDLIGDRYLLIGPRVVLDTQPSQMPACPEEVPETLKTYLKLLPGRLHIPQVYGYIPGEDPETEDPIWLLEYGSIPLDEQGLLRYSEILPRLVEVWPEATPLQQLLWIWQIIRLWNPLQTYGVVSSLLDTDLLRVNSLNVQLLELRTDHPNTPQIQELVPQLSELATTCQPQLADFLGKMINFLHRGLITTPEDLARLLEKALNQVATDYHFHYQVATATHVGPSREHNEDYCYPLPRRKTATKSAKTTSPPLVELPEESSGEPPKESPAKLPVPEPPTVTPSLPLDAVITPLPVPPRRPLNTEEEEVLAENPVFVMESLPTPESEAVENINVLEDHDRVAVPTEEPLLDLGNQQFFAVTSKPGNTQEKKSTLVIVCDGIGGQDAGEVASQLAVESLATVIKARILPTLNNPTQLLLPQLHRCISDVNDRINYRNDQEKRSNKGRMGTTLVMILADRHQAYLSNVGDSRCYWITEDSCQQITLDDDVATREARLGYALYREAVLTPRSGALTQAVGMGPSANLHPALARLFVPQTSLFLLCSDGLCDFDRVEQYWQTELLPALTGDVDLETASDRLIALANRKNGHDNATVALIRVTVTPPAKMTEPLSYENIQDSLPPTDPDQPSAAPILGSPVPLNPTDDMTPDFEEVNRFDLSRWIDLSGDKGKFWLLVVIGIGVWSFTLYSVGNLLNPPPPPPPPPPSLTPEPPPTIPGNTAPPAPPANAPSPPPAP